MVYHMFIIIAMLSAPTNDDRSCYWMYRFRADTEFFHGKGVTLIYYKVYFIYGYKSWKSEHFTSMKKKKKCLKGRDAQTYPYNPLGSIIISTYGERMKCLKEFGVGGLDTPHGVVRLKIKKQANFLCEIATCEIWHFVVRGYY